ncbi:MAG: SWIM zinc finger family protein, partial [Bacteroidota bacterium]
DMAGVNADDCHVKGGTPSQIYAFTCLSPDHHIYILAFGIAAGGESKRTWTWMLERFKSAMPTLEHQTIETGSVTYAQTSGVTVRPDSSPKYRDTIFVSDRDKGLLNSLEEVFPNHLSTYCVKHLQRNVNNKFTKKAGDFVFHIAKTFSRVKEGILFDKLYEVSKGAVTYLEEIEAKCWRSTEWIEYSEAHFDDENCQLEVLPPRYGILTSNTSESFNNMISGERECGWFYTMVGLVKKMSTRITEGEIKYRDKNDDEIIPEVKKIIQDNWHDSISLQVFQSGRDANLFTVTEWFNWDDGSLAERPSNCVATNKAIVERDMNEAGTQPGASEAARKVRSSNARDFTLRPNHKWCSCGQWQEHRYPCRHAVAYFRLWLNHNLETIHKDHVSFQYKYGSVKAMYSHRFDTVNYDSLKIDKVRKPIPYKTGLGRKKMKRIASRGEEPQAGGKKKKTRKVVRCTLCKDFGHNSRSCRLNPKNQARNATVAPVGQASSDGSDVPVDQSNGPAQEATQAPDM